MNNRNDLCTVEIGNIKVTATIEQLVELGRVMKESRIRAEWVDIAYEILKKYDDEWDDKEEFSIFGDNVKITQLE